MPTGRIELLRRPQRAMLRPLITSLGGDLQEGTMYAQGIAAIATQSRRGHEHGSWYFHDEHGKSGGRLYTTAMCVMILEVYYRHMPLYGKRAVARDL